MPMESAQVVICLVQPSNSCLPVSRIHLRYLCLRSNEKAFSKAHNNNEDLAIARGRQEPQQYHLRRPPSTLTNKSSRTDTSNSENMFNAENYRPGYPRLSEQLSQDSSLQLFPRFKRARMRLMLAMQYRVAKLEKELDELDDQEQHETHLTSFKNDDSAERTSKLAQLHSALLEYDNFAQRTQWAMNMPDVGERGLENLKYLGHTVDRAEIAYIEKSTRDMMYIGVVRGRGMEKLTPLAESIVESVYKVRSTFAGRQTYFIPNPAIRAVARVLAAATTILVLLVPVIILNFVHTTVWKFVVIFVAAALFVSGIAVGSTASMSEIFVGGATYAAVLVVFVSQNEISNST